MGIPYLIYCILVFLIGLKTFPLPPRLYWTSKNFVNISVKIEFFVFGVPIPPPQSSNIYHAPPSKDENLCTCVWFFFLILFSFTMFQKESYFLSFSLFSLIIFLIFCNHLFFNFFRYSITHLPLLMALWRVVTNYWKSIRR